MLPVCKICGGHMECTDNYYICNNCGNKWEMDVADDMYAIERANAWAALRDGDFEKATELFGHCITASPDDHEGYWGRALASAGIIYVTDVNEDKASPTCHNITEASFINNTDVAKALSLAPKEIAANYQTQAERIEAMRSEWLEKASLEPAYDVFISYKGSDCEHDMKRTQDSLDAQGLYNALIAVGYKVFFSHVSLHDKIPTQSEPYIYNAIKTAKVMIVFGEKTEDFNSAYIKKEWSRFNERIENGEKHKNSLVVVYKTMTPTDLPIALKSRLCLNAENTAFLTDLTRHIKRVIEECKKNVRLEKIEITGDQIPQKASSLPINTVQTHEIGMGAFAETSISEQQSIGLVYTYLEEKQWQEAAALAEDVLFNNPSCAQAVWCTLLARYHAPSDASFVKSLNALQPADYIDIEKTLNCASKEFAEKILVLLYDSESSVSETTYSSILHTILPFSFCQRDEKIAAAFRGVISHNKWEPFRLLLNTLHPSDVDTYIEYNYAYASHTPTTVAKAECLLSILTVDEGHLDAWRDLVRLDLITKKPTAEIVSDLESLLKYTTDINKEVISCLNWLSANLSTEDECQFAKQLIRYYKDDIATLKDDLIRLCYRIIYIRLFDQAEYFLNLILTFDADNAAVYWAICLMKTEAINENEIITKEKLLRDAPEFNRYLTLVNDARRRQCISLSRRQVEQRLADLTKDADTITVKRRAPLGCVGYFLFIIAAMTLLIGAFVALLHGGYTLIWIALVELIFGLLCMIRTPSISTIRKNKKKKAALEAEIRAIEERK